jgi:hypothetical protein
MRIISAAVVAVVVGTAASCGTAATVTVTTSPTTVPPGQPGASPPPSASCLTAGNCTAAQQRQVAASNGITNPGGLNGCLVSGDCTASQQQGIAVGMPAAGSSSAPTPSSPATDGCTVVSLSSLDDGAMVTTNGADCAQIEPTLAYNTGTTWTTVSAIPAGWTAASTECTLTSNAGATMTVTVLNQDDGGMSPIGTTADDVCSAFETAGWTG